MGWHDTRVALLFAADRTKTVRELMRENPVFVLEDADQRDVAKVFGEHHLLAIPVVDSEHRMQGIVTVDDIVDHSLIIN